ncbi:hypothetical protein KIL84_019222 [Mauremys mutica]|uniref:Uncharacterized protein n=1 Tax=Mauremys mutica TaxID=74926 RepID=A0A9D3XW82_9SAUR|nr:hypothetical protein KIL84_019222 [Mauremys mutica]
MYSFKRKSKPILSSIRSMTKALLCYKQVSQLNKQAIPLVQVTEIGFLMIKSFLYAIKLFFPRKVFLLYFVNCSPDIILSNTSTMCVFSEWNTYSCHFPNPTAI